MQQQYFEYLGTAKLHINLYMRLGVRVYILCFSYRLKQFYRNRTHYLYENYVVHFP